MLNTPVEVANEKENSTPSIYEAILKTLLYFDIFNYPLKKDEIIQFLGKSCSRDEFDKSLQILLTDKLIFQFNEFFSAQDKKENVVRRIKGNEMARKFLPIAKQKANLIGMFPYVVSVMASGSLSKEYMDETSDLDFYIVTTPGRLWIARMLLVIYKRIFLHKSHRHFRINYFVSSDNLEAEEKNQFTATELATVIPLYGQHVYSDILKQNSWLKSFFPNHTPRPIVSRVEKNGFTKRTFERILNLLGGDSLDRLCMRETQRRWEKMYKNHCGDSNFEIAFKSKNHASTIHARHYQKKVIQTLEERWNLCKQNVSKIMC